MRYLITGGAGFIGSHLADALIARGDEVLILDDLSTGNVENIEGAIASGRAQFVEGSVCDEAVVDECMEWADACFHLASAVGVKLIVDRSVDSLGRSVRGSQVITEGAHRLGRRLLFASTSEIYGKNSSPGLTEQSDRILGPPSIARWSYSTAKAFGEALTLGYHRERGSDNVVVRLFNTVGPRQTGQYGMVIPNFVRQALAGEPITVFGDGKQSRAFTHVSDVVGALVKLVNEPKAVGQVVNIGNTVEITIEALAERVRVLSGSTSSIKYIPYEEAYESGFEDMPRRVPDLARIEGLIGYKPVHGLDDILIQVIEYFRRK